MTTEPVRVAFWFNAGPAMLSAVRNAVQFQACNAGLDAQASAEFAGASEDVCRETLSKVADPDSPIEVTLDTYGDRIELAILSSGQQMPAIGLETFAFGNTQGAGGLNGLELLSRVDRVLYGNDDGAARTTLVKYLQSK